MLAHLCVFFLLKSKLVAREQGRFAQKASAHLFRISDCGFRIFWISFSIRIPQSAFRNLDARPAQEEEIASWFLCKRKEIFHRIFATRRSCLQTMALPPGHKKSYLKNESGQEDPWLGRKEENGEMAKRAICC
jgi:hypothetical protein